MSSQVQSVTFPRELFTPHGAMRWLKRHEFKPIKKVDKTLSQLKYRIIDPSEFDHFSTRTLGDGVALVIGFPEKKMEGDLSTPPKPLKPSKKALPPSTKPSKGGEPPTAWVLHVKAYRVSHPGMSYKDARRAASASWKKTK